MKLFLIKLNYDKHCNLYLKSQMKWNVHTVAEADKEMHVLQVTHNLSLSGNLEIRNIKSSFLILSDKLILHRMYQ